MSLPYTPTEVSCFTPSETNEGWKIILSFFFWGGEWSFLKGDKTETTRKLPGSTGLATSKEPPFVPNVIRSRWLPTRGMRWHNGGYTNPRIGFSWTRPWFQWCFLLGATYMGFLHGFFFCIVRWSIFLSVDWIWFYGPMICSRHPIVPCLERSILSICCEGQRAHTIVLFCLRGGWEGISELLWEHGASSSLWQKAGGNLQPLVTMIHWQWLRLWRWEIPN